MSDQYNQDKLSQDFQNTSIGGGAADQQQQPQQQGGYQGGYQAPQQGGGYYNMANAQSFVPQGGYQQYQQYGQQPQQQYQQYNNQYQNYNNTRGGYQQGGRGGYQQNYNNRGGYQQNYNNRQYQGYDAYQQQQQQPQQAQGMSLADFQKQKEQQQANLNKPKKTLKLAPSSGIKLANAKKEPSPAAAAAPAAAPAEPKVEAKQEVATEKKEEPVATPAAAAPASTTEKEQPALVARAIGESSTPSIASMVATPSGTNLQSSDSLAKQQEDEVDEEVVNDMFGGKDHVSIIFMGHVDAGKSTMGGNILYLTGSVDKRTVEKYEREAKDAGRQGWYLSWVMDTNKEERNDGKTIEVGKAYFETDKRRYTILDAPGHKMYVSEMIGGASQADVGILVISARKGEYETGFEKGGQTREHALLAKTQGVNKIIVVVNKMDDPTVDWSQERYNECTTKLGAYLKGIGYNKDDIVYMPVSGYTGAGLKERIDSKICSWYNGPALLEYLDNMDHLNRKINGHFMLPISGKMKDMGTVVEGKIESGHIKKNGNLLLMPNKTSVEVLTIYNETEQECDVAYSGEQVRLRLKGVEEEDLQPGYVLTSPQYPVKTVTKFEAQIAIVELKSILSNGFSCVMHLHTAIEEIKFVELKHKLERGTNRKSKKPPAFAKKGMKIIAVLEVNESICAETYTDYPQLGRFTLRDQGTTIAIGKITKLL
ncbi:Eukaryotic peptide chain release factor GTP-binding subunit [Spathaspora sp. JA1]|nr:Eukaryotic peptide chain release factor GTP-binding subunit [Spathaspora sp. JA1]